MRQLKNYLLLFCWPLLITPIDSFASERALASLVRVSIDSVPASKEVLATTFNYESIWLDYAGQAGYRYVDLTPLKSDFQLLRYSHQCAVVDGNSKRDDCADSGNYAEAVLEVLNNIRLGVENQHLSDFKPTDRILLGDTQILNDERSIRVELYLRIYNALDRKLLYSDTLSREMRLGAKASREGMTKKLVTLVVQDGVQKLASTNP